MKAKRTFIVLAIVIAVLALGIAYAAVTANLEIRGNATGSFDTANFQVYFSEHSAVTGTGGVVTTGSTADINSEDPTIGTFNFTGFTTVGQKQSATWTILNDNDADIDAVNVTTTIENAGNNTEYFKVTKTDAPSTIKAGQTGTVTVTVECMKTPEEDVSSTGIVIGVSAQSQANAAASN